MLLTPFHNMALMSPATTDADVGAHSEVFARAVRSSVARTVTETRLLIGGEQVAGAGDALEVENPYSEEMIASVALPSGEQVDAAIAAAREAARVWAQTPALERGELLHEVAARLRARTDELAEMMTREGGKPLVENADEVGWTAAAFDYYAEMGRNFAGRVIPPIESVAARAGAQGADGRRRLHRARGTTRCCCWPGSSRRRWRPATRSSASRPS